MYRVLLTSVMLSGFGAIYCGHGPAAVLLPEGGERAESSLPVEAFAKGGGVVYAASGGAY